MEGVLALLLLVFGFQWAKKGFPGLMPSSRPERVPVAHRMDSAQYQAALDAYKHAVSEKMDVMRTAIQMGWGDDELKRLDARLEELIGEAELKRLIDGELPQAATSPQEQLDAQAELSRLREPLRS